MVGSARNSSERRRERERAAFWRERLQQAGRARANGNSRPRSRNPIFALSLLLPRARKPVDGAGPRSRMELILAPPPPPPLLLRPPPAGALRHNNGRAHSSRAPRGLHSPTAAKKKRYSDACAPLWPVAQDTVCCSGCATPPTPPTQPSVEMVGAICASARTHDRRRPPYGPRVIHLNFDKTSGPRNRFRRAKAGQTRRPVCF